MSKRAENGAKRVIKGKPCVYYDGYWIRRYEPPRNTLEAKRQLIEQLTRRLFHHAEPGINTPGKRLDEAREAYEGETDPALKRVKGAMLAGALFNRATDLLTSLVELQEEGVNIESDNELLKDCEACFMEALQLGKTVRHKSGEEGIDELWGEPFKAFSMPIDAFYESRYLKVAQTMREIDHLTERLVSVFRAEPAFEGFEETIHDFAEAAKLESETLRSDPEIFEVWPQFVTAGERLLRFKPKLPRRPTLVELQRVQAGMELIREGKELLTHLATVRVPMPKSTEKFLRRCDAYATGV